MEITTRNLLVQDLYRIHPKPEKLVNLSLVNFIGLVLKYMIIHSPFRVILFYRITNYLYKHSSYWLIFFRVISKLITKIQIPYQTKIDGGLLLPHVDCIVINATCVIGKNVTILQGVTLGGNIGKRKMLKNELKGSPIVEDNVLIGAGAKVLGPITIGENSMIGANAVVTKDIPKNSVAVGIPAKVIKNIERNYIDIELELKKSNLIIR